MLRLKANKTSLYKLVSEFENLPPMRKTEFRKAYRSPDYWLKWSDSSDFWCEAFLSTCCGECLLAIKKREIDGPKNSRIVHKLEVKSIIDRGMTEEFTTARSNT